MDFPINNNQVRAQSPRPSLQICYMSQLTAGTLKRLEGGGGVNLNKDFARIKSCKSKKKLSVARLTSNE